MAEDTTKRICNLNQSVLGAIVSIHGKRMYSGQYSKIRRRSWIKNGILSWYEYSTIR